MNVSVGTKSLLIAQFQLTFFKQYNLWPHMWVCFPLLMSGRMSVCVKKKGTETNTTMLQRALRCGKWLNSTHPQELRGGCCTSPPLTPPTLQIKLQNVIHAYDSIFNTGHFICLAPFLWKGNSNYSWLLWLMIIRTHWLVLVSVLIENFSGRKFSSITLRV